MGCRGDDAGAATGGRESIATVPIIEPDGPGDSGSFILRYRFRGLVRDTGRAVEGHVEADELDRAYGALADHGIVTESLVADPKALNLSPEIPAMPELADA